MQTSSYGVLFIGLIFDILLIIFVIVACLLIYSLLQISVDTKTFEFGVLRLIGLSKTGFISVILTQACYFVVPSVILGFSLSIPAMYFIYSVLFTEEMGITPKLTPEGWAIIRALFIGIIIPFLSAILPIKGALKKELTEALRPVKSSNAGIEIEFINNKSKNRTPLILIGAITVIFGASIYYLLPLALLQQNLSLILQVFFAILLGLIFGLTILATNLQGFLERILLHIFLFWEKKSTKLLLRKNMIAHKRKNQLTAIIYALSLGCIIFLLLSSKFQIRALTSNQTS